MFFVPKCPCWIFWNAFRSKFTLSEKSTILERFFLHFFVCKFFWNDFQSNISSEKLAERIYSSFIPNFGMNFITKRSIWNENHSRRVLNKNRSKNSYFEHFWNVFRSKMSLFNILECFSLQIYNFWKKYNFGTIFAPIFFSKYFGTISGPIFQVKNWLNKSTPVTFQFLEWISLQNSHFGTKIIPDVFWTKIVPKMVIIFYSVRVYTNCPSFFLPLTCSLVRWHEIWFDSVRLVHVRVLAIAGSKFCSSSGSRSKLKINRKSANMKKQKIHAVKNKILKDKQG